MLATTVFLLGAIDYVSGNSYRLLNLMAGTNPTATAAPAPSPGAAPGPKETPQPKAEGPALQWKSAPVEFLEETLPEVTPNPKRAHNPVQEINNTGKNNVQNFSVNDTSETGLDLAEELKKELPFETGDLSKPTVLLYHTHSCESYLTGFSGFYYTDNSYRSTELDRNVAVVGETMKKALEAKGIGVIHDTTIHDAPAFNGAYARSMDTVQSYLEKYPSIKVTIDLHRDSMTTDEGVSYKPTTTVNGRKAAQIMIITGADPTGELEFESWQDNLIFALKLQKKAADLYDGLMRPLMFCQRKYNMHATNASLIFEVGTEVNTFAEAKYSGTLMGDVLAEVLLDNSGK